ncbi:MAG TPA: hypothetical protein VF756_07230 [Thermoanaerobaculia bacterium]
MDTTQDVSTARGAPLAEGSPPHPVREEPNVVMRISLKSERVQQTLPEPETGSPANVACELTVNQPQPVTIELREPRIVITLLGNPGGDQTGEAG